MGRNDFRRLFLPMPYILEEIIMKYGVQMYGCLKEFHESPENFFSRTKEMGYSLVEPCIWLDADESGVDKISPFLWKYYEVIHFYEMMKQYKLNMRSCHVFSVNILERMDMLLNMCKVCNIEAIVINCFEKIEETCVEFAEYCNAINEKIEKEGVQLWIHNGPGEIEKEVNCDGKSITVLEKIMSLCNNKIKVQIDTGWVLYGGKDPAEYILRLEDRIGSIHFKDMAKDYKNKQGNEIFEVLGYGATDVESIFRSIYKLGISEVIIDQDLTKGDFFDDLSESINIMKMCVGSDR